MLGLVTILSLFHVSTAFLLPQHSLLLGHHPHQGLAAAPATAGCRSLLPHSSSKLQCINCCHPIKQRHRQVVKRRSQSPIVMQGFLGLRQRQEDARDQGGEDEGSDEVDDDEDEDDDENDDEDEEEEEENVNTNAFAPPTTAGGDFIVSRKILKTASLLFRRVSWLSWWVQLVTSTVSAVILIFSNAFTERNVRRQVIGNGVLLAGVGMIISFVSLFWTFSYIVQARGWLSKGNKVNARSLKVSLRRSLRYGLWVLLVGMACTLLGAEQIVGMLVAKVLYSQGFSLGGPIATELSPNAFRPLDIFVVQANTNTLLSLYAGILMNLYLRTQVDKFFTTPPAAEGRAAA